MLEDDQCTKDLSVTAHVPCDSCDARGYPLKAKSKVCPTCRGIGRVTIPPFTSTCSTCKGSGQIIKEYCMSCGGLGIVDGAREVKVTIPAGVDSGDTIRIPEAGNSGPRGSQPGWLYIKLKVAEDPIFARDGADVYVDSNISFTQEYDQRKLTMSGETVKLLGHWASPFELRVIWALKLKEIEYEYVEEDLPNKSPLLLEYNPVHKKIPVLAHGGKPLAESLVILEYLDETWKQNPILPDDPYERAQARFWARFVDEKCMPSIMSAFTKKGEEKEKAAKEASENLKILESGLGKKQFFGGESIGFVDIAAGWIGMWTRMVEEIADVKIIDTAMMPLLESWFQRVLQVPILKECLPPQDRLLERFKGFHKFLTGGSS